MFMLFSDYKVAAVGYFWSFFVVSAASAAADDDAVVAGVLGYEYDSNTD